MHIHKVEYIAQELITKEKRLERPAAMINERMIHFPFEGIISLFIIRMMFRAL